MYSQSCFLVCILWRLTWFVCRLSSLAIGQIIVSFFITLNKKHSTIENNDGFLIIVEYKNAIQKARQNKSIFIDDVKFYRIVEIRIIKVLSSLISLWDYAVLLYRNIRFSGNVKN